MDSCGRRRHALVRMQIYKERMTATLGSLRHALEQAIDTASTVEVRVGPCYLSVSISELLGAISGSGVDLSAISQGISDSSVSLFGDSESDLTMILDSDILTNSVPNACMLDLSDYAALREHFRLCLMKLQQQCCKVVCKAWIRHLMPKKQTTHPYKKGEAARPAWWPKEARHKEPDHLYREERMAIMLSILMTPHLMTATDLMAATNQCISQIPRDRINTLFEIYHIRDIMDSGVHNFVEVSDFKALGAVRSRSNPQKATNVFIDPPEREKQPTESTVLDLSGTEVPIAPELKRQTHSNKRRPLTVKSANRVTIGEEKFSRKRGWSPSGADDFGDRDRHASPTHHSSPKPTHVPPLNFILRQQGLT